MISYLLAILVGVLALAADQITKACVMSNMTLYEEGPVLIKGVLDTIYIHNTGGAWGILSDHTWILVCVTAVIMLVCIVLLYRYGTKDKLMFWSIILVLSGGIGNMIDRIFRGGKVVDFLHFTFMPDFPVFNIADCAVVIGVVLMVLYLLIGIARDFRAKKEPIIEADNNGDI